MEEKTIDLIMQEFKIYKDYKIVVIFQALTQGVVSVTTIELVKKDNYKKFIEQDPEILNNNEEWVELRKNEDLYMEGLEDAVNVNFYRLLVDSLFGLKYP